MKRITVINPSVSGLRAFHFGMGLLKQYAQKQNYNFEVWMVFLNLLHKDAENEIVQEITKESIIYRNAKNPLLKKGQNDWNAIINETKHQYLENQAVNTSKYKIASVVNLEYGVYGQISEKNHQMWMKRFVSYTQNLQPPKVVLKQLSAVSNKTQYLFIENPSLLMQLLQKQSLQKQLLQEQSLQKQLLHEQTLQEQSFQKYFLNGSVQNNQELNTSEYKSSSVVNLVQGVYAQLSEKNYPVWTNKLTAYTPKFINKQLSAVFNITQNQLLKNPLLEMQWFEKQSSKKYLLEKYSLEKYSLDGHSNQKFSLYGSTLVNQGLIENKYKNQNNINKNHAVYSLLINHGYLLQVNKLAGITKKFSSAKEILNQYVSQFFNDKKREVLFQDNISSQLTIVFYKTKKNQWLETQLIENGYLLWLNKLGNDTKKFPSTKEILKRNVRQFSNEKKREVLSQFIISKQLTNFFNKTQEKQLLVKELLEKQLLEKQLLGKQLLEMQLMENEYLQLMNELSGNAQKFSSPKEILRQYASHFLNEKKKEVLFQSIIRSQLTGIFDRTQENFLSQKTLAKNQLKNLTEKYWLEEYSNQTYSLYGSTVANQRLEENEYKNGNILTENPAAKRNLIINNTFVFVKNLAENAQKLLLAKEIEYKNRNILNENHAAYRKLIINDSLVFVNNLAAQKLRLENEILKQYASCFLNEKKKEVLFQSSISNQQTGIFDKTLEKNLLEKNLLEKNLLEKNLLEKNLLEKNLLEVHSNQTYFLYGGTPANQRLIENEYKNRNIANKYQAVYRQLIENRNLVWTTNLFENAQKLPSPKDILKQYAIQFYARQFSNEKKKEVLFQSIISKEQTNVYNKTQENQLKQLFEKQLFEKKFFEKQLSEKQLFEKQLLKKYLFEKYSLYGNILVNQKLIKNEYQVLGNNLAENAQKLSLTLFKQYASQFYASQFSNGKKKEVLFQSIISNDQTDVYNKTQENQLKQLFEKQSFKKQLFEKQSFKKQLFEKQSFEKQLFEKQSFKKQLFEKQLLKKYLFEKYSLYGSTLVNKRLMENEYQVLENNLAGNAQKLSSTKEILKQYASQFSNEKKKEVLFQSIISKEQTDVYNKTHEKQLFEKQLFEKQLFKKHLFEKYLFEKYSLYGSTLVNKRLMENEYQVLENNLAGNAQKLSSSKEILKQYASQFYVSQFSNEKKLKVFFQAIISKHLTGAVNKTRYQLMEDHTAYRQMIRNNYLRRENNSAGNAQKLIQYVIHTSNEKKKEIEKLFQEKFNTQLADVPNKTQYQLMQNQSLENQSLEKPSLEKRLLEKYSFYGSRLVNQRFKASECNNHYIVNKNYNLNKNQTKAFIVNLVSGGFDEYGQLIETKQQVWMKMLTVYTQNLQPPKQIFDIINKIKYQFWNRNNDSKNKNLAEKHSLYTTNLTRRNSNFMKALFFYAKIGEKTVQNTVQNTEYAKNVSDEMMVMRKKNTYHLPDHSRDSSLEEQNKLLQENEVIEIQKQINVETIDMQEIKKELENQKEQIQTLVKSHDEITNQIDSTVLYKEVTKNVIKNLQQEWQRTKLRNGR